MSTLYKYEFDVFPCEDEVEAKLLIDECPFEIDGHQLHHTEDAEKPMLVMWGEHPISGGLDPQDRHAELKEAWPNKTVDSRWRCVEYDGWDDEISDSDLEEAEEAELVQEGE